MSNVVVNPIFRDANTVSDGSWVECEVYKSFWCIPSAECGEKLISIENGRMVKNKGDEDLTRLPPTDSTLDGRRTRKPFGLSRVQPF